MSLLLAGGEGGMTRPDGLAPSGRRPVDDVLRGFAACRTCLIDFSSPNPPSTIQIKRGAGPLCICLAVDAVRVANRKRKAYRKFSIHCRTGASGGISSTSRAALSVMRQTPQLGSLWIDEFFVIRRFWTIDTKIYEILSAENNHHNDNSVLIT